MTERRVYAEKLAEEQRAAQDLGALQAQITEKEAQVCGLCNDDSFLCSRQGAQCLGAIVYAKQPSQHTQITTCTHAHTHTPRYRTQVRAAQERVIALKAVVLRGDQAVRQLLDSMLAQ